MRRNEFCASKLCALCCVLFWQRTKGPEESSKNATPQTRTLGSGRDAKNKSNKKVVANKKGRLLAMGDARWREGESKNGTKETNRVAHEANALSRDEERASESQERVHFANTSD